MSVYEERMSASAGPGLGRQRWSSSVAWAAAGVAWAAGVLAGYLLMVEYGAAAGAMAEAPARWPEASRLSAPGEAFSLVVVAHPHCACTRATLSELARLLSAAEGRLEAQVIFTWAGVLPGGAGALMVQAGAISGVRVIPDPTGEETRRFGARTSGQAYLYSPGGTLLFAGGLTASRGHEGDSLGRRIVLSRVFEGGDSAEAGSSSVFGCALSSHVTRGRVVSTLERFEFLQAADWCGGGR